MCKSTLCSPDIFKNCENCNVAVKTILNYAHLPITCLGCHSEMMYRKNVRSFLVELGELS